MELSKTEESDLSARIKDKSIVTSKFKEVLQGICYSIGIREALDLTDIDSIFRFIGRNYGLLSLEDLIEAFELFSADKLSFNDPKFGHYGQFDLTFIGKVLSAYNRFKNDLNKKNKPYQELPEPTYSEEVEREKCFEIIKNDIFLDSSERNGDVGEFPDLIIASWKDAYLHMVSKNMLIELEGENLRERLVSVEKIRLSQISDPRNKLANSISAMGKGTDIKNMLFFKLEVMDWFKTNKEILLYEKKR